MLPSTSLFHSLLPLLRRRSTRRPASKKRDSFVLRKRRSLPLSPSLSLPSFSCNSTLSLVASNGSRPIRICLPPPTTHGVTQAPTEQSFLCIYNLDIHLDSGKSASDGERMRGIFSPFITFTILSVAWAESRFTRGNSFWAKKEKDEDEAGSQSATPPSLARSVRGPSSERSSRRVEGSGQSATTRAADGRSTLAKFNQDPKRLPSPLLTLLLLLLLSHF